MAQPHQVLREKVRSFLADELARGLFLPRCDSWLTGFDPAFSRRLAAQGWVGMTIPARYGGSGSSAVDRFVVAEELLAAGAPVAAHWLAERQIAPTLVRHGTDAQRQEWLPRIAAGEACFAVGLSEPDAGSDLAAVRTKATAADGGWRLTGTKLWSSGAHRAHAIVVLARSDPQSAGHAGLTQFIVTLPDERVEIRPIVSISGEHHFNEVVLGDVFVPAEMVLGTVGAGWPQVVAELAFERSGPERFLSTMPLLDRVAPERGQEGGHLDARTGQLFTELLALRALSLRVARELDSPDPPAVLAAAVKDLGTLFEQASVYDARQYVKRHGPDALLDDLLAQATLQSPNFTLRGGTNEILRTIIAKAVTR
jgi:alkylation response protein AidB-like acyl-CoA dehydrogenase